MSSFNMLKHRTDLLLNSQQCSAIDDWIYMFRFQSEMCAHGQPINSCPLRNPCAGARVRWRMIYRLVDAFEYRILDANRKKCREKSSEHNEGKLPSTLTVFAMGVIDTFFWKGKNTVMSTQATISTINCRSIIELREDERSRRAIRTPLACDSLPIVKNRKTNLRGRWPWWKSTNLKAEKKRQFEFIAVISVRERKHREFT